MSDVTDPAVLEYIHGINERIRALEAHAERVGRQVGVPFGDPTAGSGGMPEDVVALARAGKKIEAIKRYRELTGLGLREAKDAVDAI
jgi:ribosomal protein L7/L12